MTIDRTACSRRRYLVATGVLSGATIAGCIGEPGDSDQPELLDPAEYAYDRDRPDDEGAARDSTMVYTQPVSRAENFDPIISNDGYSGQVISSLFDGLYEWDDGLTLEPKVAVDFPDVERDGTRYLYEIHSGIEFHDGTAVTAEDVAHSFIAPVAEQTPNAASYSMIDDVSVVDDYQVQVDLSFAYGPWTMSTQGIYIVNKQTRLSDVDAYDEAETPENRRSHVNDDYNTNPVASGPFVWADFQHGEYVELERNDAYWDEPTPYLQSIRFEDIEDDATRVSEIITGATDAIVDVPNDDWEQLEADENVRLHATETPVMSYLFFNTNDGAGTANRHVRRGIAHAFSMHDYAITHRNNVAAPAVTPTSPITNELWDFPVDTWESELYPAYDPDLAKELLDEHAPSDWTPRFVASGPREAFAERIASRLDEIGYDLEVQTVDFTTMLEYTIAGDGDPDVYELYFLSWTGGPDPDSYLYPMFHESQEGILQGHYYDGRDDFHDTILAARESGDHEERQRMYVNLIEEILEELPVLPALSTHNTMATRRRIKDLHLHPFTAYNPRLVSDYGNVWVDD